MIIRKLLFLASVLSFSLAVSAQVPQHDKQKEKQIRSMEAGHWDFAPDWYYYFLHKNYSGAETYWKWKGFKSGLHVRFKESKSNVKGVAARRLLQSEADKAKAKVVETERKKIKELNERETVGLAVYVPKEYIRKVCPVTKDNYGFVIGTDTRHLSYRIACASDNETFGFHSSAEWFSFLKEWGTSLYSPLKVRVDRK